MVLVPPGTHCLSCRVLDDMVRGIWLVEVHIVCAGNGGSGRDEVGGRGVEGPSGSKQTGGQSAHRGRERHDGDRISKQTVACTWLESKLR